MGNRDETPKASLRKDPPMSSLQRLVHQAMGDNQDLGHEADPAREKFPALWEMMSVTQVGKDWVKEPARLSLSFVVGGVLVTLSDPMLKRAKRVTVIGLEDALSAIDAAIADPTVPWVPWGKGEPTLRKRKPRN